MALWHLADDRLRRWQILKDPIHSHRVLEPRCRESHPRVDWQAGRARRLSGYGPSRSQGAGAENRLRGVPAAKTLARHRRRGHACGGRPRARDPPAPNIVLVMTDDQALSQVGPRYMPKVTKLLQNQGTAFENAFLTTPLCCPSRAALLTGQYGHNNGVLTNSYRFLHQKRNVLPVWLPGGLRHRPCRQVPQSVPARHPPDGRGAGLGRVVHAARHEPRPLLRLGPFQERQEDPLWRQARRLRAAGVRAERRTAYSPVRAAPQAALPRGGRDRSPPPPPRQGSWLRPRAGSARPRQVRRREASPAAVAQ
ncbi:MAG: hypothetical protein E6G48_06360 [Actinobacteria bacterium]|nr:MAG: hypothetical protein E6G48_06360 [Actinomycetota bacterium]